MDVSSITFLSKAIDAMAPESAATTARPMPHCHKPVSAVGEVSDFLSPFHIYSTALTHYQKTRRMPQGRRGVV
jgi:hypothetical protein